MGLWPSFAAASAAGIPDRCHSVARRWRRSCGENNGVPVALHARPSAVLNRVLANPTNTWASRSRSFRGTVCRTA
jgi:hypothetical protein